MARFENCDWCGRSMADLGLRPEAECCSAKCRKRRHRFGSQCVTQARAAQPLTLIYADPPYPGKAHYYEGHPDFAGEVDHVALVRELEGTSEGWALSTSAEALPAVLRICDELRLDVRIGSWTRGARGNIGARRPRSAWEPVIYRGGRLSDDPPADALVCGVGHRTSDPKRVIGTKPGTFAFWIFALLGARPGDRFVDRYPGSGGIGRAWDLFERRSADASKLEAGRVAPGSSTRPEVLRAVSADRDASSRGPGRLEPECICASYASNPACPSCARAKSPLQPGRGLELAGTRGAGETGRVAPDDPGRVDPDDGTRPDVDVGRVAPAIGTPDNVIPLRRVPADVGTRRGG